MREPRTVGINEIFERDLNAVDSESEKKTRERPGGADGHELLCEQIDGVLARPRRVV